MSLVTYPLNKITYNAEDAQIYSCTRERGVFSADADFEATVTGARTIRIAPGLAWMKPTRFSGFAVALKTAQTLTFDVANPNLPRYDLIKLSWSMVSNETVLTVAKGTPASSPLIPRIEQSESKFELGLYYVKIQPASTKIAERDISSLKLHEFWCGVMRDGVTGIPTAQIQKQASDLISKLGSDADEYLAQLRQTITDIAAGTDTMLQTVFNKSGRKEQVAFHEDLAVVNANVKELEKHTKPRKFFNEEDPNVSGYAKRLLLDGFDGTVNIQLGEGVAPTYAPETYCMGQIVSNGSDRCAVILYGNKGYIYEATWIYDKNGYIWSGWKSFPEEELINKKLGDKTDNAEFLSFKQQNSSEHRKFSIAVASNSSDINAALAKIEKNRTDLDNILKHTKERQLFNKENPDVLGYAKNLMNSGFDGTVNIQVGQGANTPNTYCMGQIITNGSDRCTVILFGSDANMYKLWYLNGTWYGWYKYVGVEAPI